MIILQTPIRPDEVRELRVNDTFFVTGLVYTARDAAHELLLDRERRKLPVPFDVGNYPCFHCGPVMKRANGIWQVVSAGPTTSARMDLFEDQFMETFGTRIFIGKGGMGERTSTALKKFGALYAQFTGGAGSLVTGSVEKVDSVHFLEELGIPEAVWVFQVREFGPLLVTMDSTGASIHRDLATRITENLERLKKSL